jgi:hypothetical protein
VSFCHGWNHQKHPKKPIEITDEIVYFFYAFVHIQMKQVQQAEIASHQITLITPISACYFQSYAVLQLFIEHVVFYQEKSFTFYNV